MSSMSSRKGDGQRRPLQTSKSFSRIEPTSPNSSTRTQRASTIQNGSVPEIRSSNGRDSSDKSALGSRSDIFEKTSEGEETEELTESTGKLPADFDELPIELISLTDSFIDSLSAKVHPTPPTVDKLSTLFQDFYVLASTHINTHIAALSSRQHREQPSSATSSRNLSASKAKGNAKERPKGILERNTSEQQMLTADEITDRKKARKMLEQKRVALEEAVERRVCEGIYDRIWRHRSTQDEAQDEKLRSKTAALAVVGIGLTDLGIDLGEDETERTAESTSGRENEVREWLNGARKELLLMNSERYPLGKLQHLKAAHKDIVDTLSHFHPSSSADEIMPMLIYTLITSPPINVISNLYFIQRFRSESKIDGEAAYCLTNLEAATTFLETVDLASLRADETLSGPAKSDTQPSTPNNGLVSPKFPTTAASLSPAAVITTSAEPRTPAKPLPSPISLRPSIAVHNRRLSDLFQPPAQVIGAAGDAMLTTADQSFKTIGNSLGDSYKFLIGKLKERQENSPEDVNIVVPKTLDDARKLIRTPPLEDDGSASGDSSMHSPEDRTKSDKVMSIIGGRQAVRDRSVDSQRSSGSGSGKKVAFAEEKEKAPSPLAAIPTSNPALVESMRNFGSTLNPMGRIAGMAGGMPGMMRGFGRSPAPASVATKIPDGGVADLSSTFPDLIPALSPKELTAKIAPPIKRFMEIQNPGELRINEVLELLRDYRRLAGALKDLGAV